MIVISSVREIKDIVARERGLGKTIGLVPTMGALHAGHASLAQRSVQENDVTIASVFVNPTQFNDKNDLASYPRTLEADVKMLSELGVDYVFAPTAEEIYPEPDTRVFSYPPIDSVMEGAKRPGHFNGVCQIVSKLFLMVQPHRAYFGEKDFQQIAVVTAMTRALSLPVELCSCPIVREESGLALSSRNTLLTPEEKTTATTIYRTLKESLALTATCSIAEVAEFVTSKINGTEGLEVEYFQIVDGATLQPVESWDASNFIVGCITVYCGQRPVRLIDNITYKKE